MAFLHEILLRCFVNMQNFACINNISKELSVACRNLCTFKLSLCIYVNSRITANIYLPVVFVASSINDGNQCLQQQTR